MLPSPGSSPTQVKPRESAAISGWQRTSSAGDPAGISQSMPAAATSGRPSTGAATRSLPTAWCAAASSRLTSGETVLMLRCTPPAGSPATSPSGPSATARSAASSAIMVMANSASRAASAGLAQRRAPRVTRLSARAGVRLNTRSVNPVSSSRPAIASPIRPSPTNATVVIALSSPGTEQREHSRPEEVDHPRLVELPAVDEHVGDAGVPVAPDRSRVLLRVQAHGPPAVDVLERGVHLGLAQDLARVGLREQAEGV